MRAIQHRGPVQTWSISSLLAFGLVLMGYTRTMARGSAAEAFAWSVAWAMPVGIAIYARTHPDAIYRSYDKYLGAFALLSFLIVAPVLPGVLRGLATTIW
jgi:hypothetical protein